MLNVAVTRVSQRIAIAGHRARAIGHCIRAAATLGDSDRVDQLLNEVAALASAPTQPFVREILDAVRPALAALRRLGASASARRFLESLEPMTRRLSQGGVQLQAALADGFLQVKDLDRAEVMLEGALTTVLDQDVLEHPERYAAGAACLDALKHWPLHARLPRARRVIEGLDRFTDAFTASLQRIYETHKVLILEGVIDTVADRVTWQGDRVQGWLDEEEQAIRRRIIDDWRDRCGA
ncbi:MAG: hypothetical protein R3A52_19835 [Polyangiales bacterium]